MTSAVLLQLLLVASPALPDDGWQTLRWGMSQAEAGRALRDERGPFRARSAPTCGAAMCTLDPAQHGFEVRGRKPELELGVAQGKGLSSVSLHFHCNAAGGECAWLWGSLRAALEDAHGDPREEQFDEFATWRTRRARIILMLLPVAATVSVVYAADLDAGKL